MKNPTREDILSKFPHPVPRKGQIEIIEKIIQKFDEGKRIVIIEAPTGAGKSAIGYTTAQFYNDAFWVVPQKILQDQITKEFSGLNNTVDLKGRNEYPCLYWDIANELKQKGMLPANEKIPQRPGGIVTCDKGVCKTRDGLSKCDICINYDVDIRCPYFTRLEQTKVSHLAIMNMHSFMLQTSFSKQFGKRELLIIDEAHNVEPNLMDFVSIKFDDSLFQGIRFPEYETAEEYAKFLEDTNIRDQIENKIKLAKYEKDIEEESQWQSMLTKYEIFTKANSKEWVCLWKETRNKAARILELKPLFVRNYAHKYMFNYADKILLMSATILDPRVMCDSLGIGKDQVFSFQMKSTFPVENRKIYYTPVGAMSYKKKNETKPKMMKKIIEICNKYGKERGIIHTHNFELCQMILDEAPIELIRRITYQRDFRNKQDMLKAHAEKEASIIIAPAMHEGLSLDDCLSRFQLILKVPFMTIKDNPQLEKRMKISRDYYTWLTSLKLLQSSGRSIRSETDYADTFILDEDFSWWYQSAKKMLPKWFKEALVWKK